MNGCCLLPGTAYDQGRPLSHGSISYDIGNLQNPELPYMVCPRCKASLALLPCVEGTSMFCKSCRSDSARRFPAEIAIHFPGLKNLDRPHVWLFPTLVICLNCGHAEFPIPKHELRLLKRGGAGQSSASCGSSPS